MFLSFFVSAAFQATAGVFESCPAASVETLLDCRTGTLAGTADIGQVFALILSLLEASWV
jgi:hypothetical protein